jgi:hypothetical protein
MDVFHLRAYDAVISETADLLFRIAIFMFRLRLLLTSTVKYFK